LQRRTGYVRRLDHHGSGLKGMVREETSHQP
jgi:hypothetical protein